MSRFLQSYRSYVQEITADPIRAYWSAPEPSANAIAFANLVFALLPSFDVGYERAYQGRPAGMQNYGLACMASAALNVVGGYSDFWFAGDGRHFESTTAQVIEDIITGAGFLGAGAILKEDFNISGLTNAARSWASSSIGILIHVGFDAAATFLALLSAACRLSARHFEPPPPLTPRLRCFCGPNSTPHPHSPLVIGSSDLVATL